MIRAMTSTCTRDFAKVAMLNRQLQRHGVDHYLFVEGSEKPLFNTLKLGDHVQLKPVGGDNGLGKGGTIVRWHCHQFMSTIVKSDDTFVNIDSDIYFADPKVIDDLVCSPGEMKGFASSGPTLELYGTPYHHVSGMVFAVHGASFLKAVSIPVDKLVTICDDISATGMCSSEDVVASWLYKIEGGASLTNLDEKYSRGMEPRNEVWHGDLWMGAEC